MEVTSTAGCTTSMEASTEAFVEVTSTDAFAKASVEECGFLFRGSFHTLHESFHGSFHRFRGSFHGFRGSFHGSYGSFHERGEASTEAFINFHAKNK